MDIGGWYTGKKTAQQQEGGQPLFRGPDGQFRRFAQIEPMEDDSIGGWAMPAPGQPSTVSAQPDGSGNAGAQLDIRGPSLVPNQRLFQTGYPFVRRSSQPQPEDVGMLFDQSQWAHLSPVERTHELNRSNRKMNPYLKFMCGPLLRYDTINEYGMWHGAALIVTTDAESTYEPNPTLTYRWDPQPKPEGLKAQEQRVLGTELYAFGGRSGTCTFWRFLIQIPLSDSEMRIQYSINDGLEMDFFVPGRDQTMRLAAYSCNGFSAGVNPDDFRGPGFRTGYDPLWVDLLAHHAEQSFQLLIGGGDQLYCDGVAQEPELQEWVNLRSKKEKMNYHLEQEMLDAIDRFYFNHYSLMFRSGAFARANSSIPMLNMLDDHDLVDGFGSYPDEWQKAPVFNTIGSRGYFFFLLFQCFINVDKDGIDERSHPLKSTVIGVRGEYIPYPSHSLLTPIGPTAWMLMLDCRAERELGQICSEKQYAKVFKRMYALPPGVEHLIVQLGIPIVYPRMALLESMLSSKFNTVVRSGNSGSLGLKGFIDKLNGDVEPLSVLNDQWTSKHRMRERNLFIERLQQYALSRRIRISFLTGDVHCTSVGLLKTLSKGKRPSALSPALDHRYMLNVVSSAIVNTPPPGHLLKVVNCLSTERHRELHYADTDEEMIPLFENDTDRLKSKSLYIMGRRNWCYISLQYSGHLSFDIRVEKEKGHGETVGYSVLAPPPLWKAVKPSLGRGSARKTPLQF